MQLFFKEIPSPVGKLKLIANQKNLVAILWENESRPLFENALQNNHPVLLKAEKELNEYFSNKRKKFTIPLEPLGTDFQQRVWQALQEIPYGSTFSYKQIAEKIGNPKAVRAVGGAIGRNPLSIVIPCHRVIGSNGTLTGFAGGLDKKTKLLQLEAA